MLLAQFDFRSNNQLNYAYLKKRFHHLLAAIIMLQLPATIEVAAAI
jgi:hypothetical protein